MCLINNKEKIDEESNFSKVARVSNIILHVRRKKVKNICSNKCHCSENLRKKQNFTHFFPNVTVVPLLLSYNMQKKGYQGSKILSFHVTIAFLLF